MRGVPVDLVWPDFLFYFAFQHLRFRQTRWPTPIGEYDDLTAAQIISRLDELETADLRKVRDHERRHANRKTVLSAVERKLA